MVSVLPYVRFPLFESGAFGFRRGGEVPAIGEREFRLKHHAEFIGDIEIFLGRSPTVMAHIVESVLAGNGEAAVEFALLRRWADRVRIDGVVAVAAQENRLAVEEEFSSGDLELAHAETDRTRVDHCIT